VGVDLGGGRIATDPPGYICVRPLGSGSEPGREQTPFLAPEAYLPELMTPAADVFALGATLYALLGGIGLLAVNPPRLPFAAEQLPDLPRVSWALMSVLRRSMAVDARDRFADAIDVRTALLAAL
jgi:hypothetical protein